MKPVAGRLRGAGYLTRKTARSAPHWRYPLLPTGCKQRHPDRGVATPENCASCLSPSRVALLTYQEITHLTWETSRPPRPHATGVRRVPMVNQTVLFVLNVCLPLLPFPSLLALIRCRHDGQLDNFALQFRKKLLLTAEHPFEPLPEICRYLAGTRERGQREKA